MSFLYSCTDRIANRKAYDSFNFLISRKIEPKYEFPNLSRVDVEAAKDEIQIALALGMSKKIDEAKANFFLLLIEIGTALKKNFVWYEDVEQRVKSLVKDYRNNEPMALSSPIFFKTDRYSVTEDELKRKARKFFKERLIVARKERDWVERIDKDSTNWFHAKEVVSNCNNHLRRSPHDIDCIHMLGTIYVLMGNNNDRTRLEIKLEQAKSLHKANIGLKTRKSNSKRRIQGLALEQAAKSLLDAMGYQTLSTKETGDGGIDLEAINDNPITGGKILIQCKDWSKPVGEPIVRDLYGLVMAEAANKGIIIATSGFTAAAKRFAVGKQLELIDGVQFYALMREYGSEEHL